MIGTSQEKYALAGVTRFDHFYPCLAFVLGEPFIKNDYLYYFDKKTAYLQLEKLYGRKGTAREIYSLVAEIISTYPSIENLILYGSTDELLDPSQLPWNLVFKQEVPDNGLWKIRMWLEDFDPNYKKLKEMKSRIRGKGYQVVEAKKDILTAEEMDFVRQSYAPQEKAPGDMFYEIIFGQLMKDKHSKFVTVKLESKTVAFAICTVLENYWALDYGHHNYSCQYSMDAAYLYVVQEAVRQKKKVVDLGGGTGGIFKFKTKFFQYHPRFKYNVTYILRKKGKEFEYTLWSYENTGLDKLVRPTGFYI